MSSGSFYDQLQKINERKKYEETDDFEKGYRAAMRVLSEHNELTQLQILDFNFGIVVKHKKANRG